MRDRSFHPSNVLHVAMEGPRTQLPSPGTVRERYRLGPVQGRSATPGSHSFPSQQRNSLSSIQLKRKNINKTKHTVSTGQGRPCLQVDIKLGVSNGQGGRGDGAITVSAEGLPSLLHPVAAVCPPHLLAAAHSGRRSP